MTAATQDAPPVIIQKVLIEAEYDVDPNEVLPDGETIREHEGIIYMPQASTILLSQVVEHEGDVWMLEPLDEALEAFNEGLQTFAPLEPGVSYFPFCFQAVDIGRFVDALTGTDTYEEV